MITLISFQILYEEDEWKEEQKHSVKKEEKIKRDEMSFLVVLLREKNTKQDFKK